MGKLSEFKEGLRAVSPGHKAEISYEGCVWLLEQLDLLERHVRNATEAQLEAEVKLARMEERDAIHE
jgi:hypothetical protein